MEERDDGDQAKRVRKVFNLPLSSSSCCTHFLSLKWEELSLEPHKRSQDSFPLTIILPVQAVRPTSVHHRANPHAVRTPTVTVGGLRRCTSISRCRLPSPAVRTAARAALCRQDHRTTTAAVPVRSRIFAQAPEKCSDHDRSFFSPPCAGHSGAAKDARASFFPIAHSGAAAPPPSHETMGLL
ncbi:hypothetical protein SESBI_19661 [Sesbania bispinosa]|nr:hypothetical protein SESBI_19661 [Sesbania bispinosa]